MTDHAGHSNDIPVNNTDALDPWVKNAQETGSKDYIKAHRILADYLVNKMSGPVLDLGCGNGVFLIVLQEKGVKNEWLFGTDLIAAHVQLARTNTGLSSIETADAASDAGIPFTGIFSVVLALNWLHVPPMDGNLDAYYRRIVRHIRRATAPGSCVVYDLPLTPTSAATRTQTLNILNQLLQDAQFAPLIQTEPLFVWQKR